MFSLPFRYFQNQIVQLLVNRLEITQFFKDHPEVSDERIVKPVFIVGLPRTGTTILHRLLARGESVGITPDGPRGPRMRVKPGAIKAAQLSGIPVLPVSGAVARRRPNATT